MSEPALQLSAVFKALTRPTMVFGVDYNYALIEFLAIFIGFINTSSFMVLLGLIPLHLFGYVVCKLDPHIFKLLAVRTQIGMVKNKKLWGCQSYDAF